MFIILGCTCTAVKSLASKFLLANENNDKTLLMSLFWDTKYYYGICYSDNVAVEH